MIILEFIAIITALIMESINMQFGSLKGVTKWLTQDKKAMLFRFRLISTFILWIGSLLYIVFAVVWCFNSFLPIQVSGIVLMALSGVSLVGFRVVGKEKPVWFIQLDSCISIGCVLIVAIARLKGF
jgi:hypothetical protein